MGAPYLVMYANGAIPPPFQVVPSSLSDPERTFFSEPRGSRRVRIRAVPAFGEPWFTPHLPYVTSSPGAVSVQQYVLLWVFATDQH